MDIRSRWLKLAYQLHRHELNGWPLDRWLGALLLAALLLAVGLVILFGWRARGLPATLVAGTLLVGLIALEVWARSAAYVTFVAEPPAARGSQPGSEPLQPQDKVEIRATGRFEVEGRSQFFVELQAFFRTFATREHAIIAYVPRSRFLWLGQWPDHEQGLWYIFFMPRQVVGVEAGVIAFGEGRRAALRVTYQGEKRQETVYLSFAHEKDRRRAWDDILWDAAFHKSEP